MKKRAGLARALALDPEILFYDEPSAGLDPVTSAQIDELILNLTRKLGVTSVVVTHEMDSAFTIGDRMAMLDKGRMLKVDSRDWFDGVRTAPESETHDWSQDMKLIRQFLRGDAQGPITDRRDVGLLERRLLGENLLDTPSIMPSRG
jgi:phospholipid/cholesterol/gamma-HCH transport system ATP-binding protein